MVIKSTYNIGRQTTIAVIVSKINSCTNEQLSSMLLAFDENVLDKIEKGEIRL